MIDIYYTEGDSWCELLIQGHAGYGPEGKDIVCAGVSAITQALLGYLEQLERPQTIYREKPTVAKGYVCVCCKKTQLVSAVFGMAVTGFRQIAAQYPDCADLTIDRIAAQR